MSSLGRTGHSQPRSFNSLDFSYIATEIHQPNGRTAMPRGRIKGSGQSRVGSAYDVWYSILNLYWCLPKVLLQPGCPLYRFKFGPAGWLKEYGRWALLPYTRTWGYERVRTLQSGEKLIRQAAGHWEEYANLPPMLQSAASPSTRSTRDGYSRARQGLIGRITPSTSCHDIDNSLRSETFICRSGRDDTGTVMRGANGPECLRITLAG